MKFNGYNFDDCKKFNGNNFYDCKKFNGNIVCLTGQLFAYFSRFNIRDLKIGVYGKQLTPDTLFALYRKLHGSRSINEKSHTCLAKCL